MLQCDLPENSQNPILLTKQLHFPHLVTLFSEHGGMKDAIKVRSRYWIISIWHLVKSIIKKCFLCQRFESKTYRYLLSASLRPYNLQLSLPFETTGVDYLGPVLVKPIFSDTDSNYFYKSQTVLFTCAVTRAFHPEVVPNLTMPSFICALKQFIWRRGIPNLKISDNGTGFKNEEFRLSEELTRMNISYKFIVADSPWWGGFWERLDQPVKRSLRKILFWSTVNYEELVTVEHKSKE